MIAWLMQTIGAAVFAVALLFVVIGGLHVVGMAAQGSDAGDWPGRCRGAKRMAWNAIDLLFSCCITAFVLAFAGLSWAKDVWATLREARDRP